MTIMNHHCPAWRSPWEKIRMRMRRERETSDARRIWITSILSDPHLTWNVFHINWLVWYISVFQKWEKIMIRLPTCQAILRYSWAHHHSSGLFLCSASNTKIWSEMASFLSAIVKRWVHYLSVQFSLIFFPQSGQGQDSRTCKGWTKFVLQFLISEIKTQIYKETSRWKIISFMYFFFVNKRTFLVSIHLRLHFETSWEAGERLLKKETNLNLFTICSLPDNKPFDKFAF